MHEIVTIQVGRRANYVATHYWNTQESYHTFPPAPPSIINHDVHFRQGLAPDGTETYLPRTLIYDLKSGFGSLARTNVLGNIDADEGTADTLWNGALTRLPPAPQPDLSAYAQSLANTTELTLPTTSTTPFFADFASTYYHPRSLVPITPPYPVTSTQSQPTAFGASGAAQSSSFEAGSDLFTTRDKDVDVLDTDLRLWLEECDGLQAVQIFTSSDDPWAGFTTRYVERLRDELGKGCIWVWGIDGTAVSGEPGYSQRNRAQQREALINTASTVHGLAEQASMFVPLSIPKSLPQGINIDRGSLWHTSALLESAIESSTLPTRLRETEATGYTLRDWQDVLSSGGRRTIAQLSFDPDFDVPEPEKDLRIRQRDEENDISTNNATQGQTSLAPPIPRSTGNRSQFKASKQFSRIESYRALQDTLDKVLSTYRPPERGDPFETYCSALEYPLLPTYPRIFNDGNSAIRVQTTLETNSRVARWVRSLQSSLQYGVGSNVGGEEREAVYSNLGDIAEKYIEDWDSAEESNEDD